MLIKPPLSIKSLHFFKNLTGDIVCSNTSKLATRLYFLSISCEYKNERNDLGIQSLSDNCNIKKANGLDLSNEIIRDLFCAKDKKEKIAFVFQIRCLSGESINYRPFFDNMVIEWKSILEQGKLRTDDRGKVRVSTLIYDVEDAILLKTKKFEKRISLKTGDYEVWLTAKECYE